MGSTPTSTPPRLFPTLVLVVLWLALYVLWLAIRPQPETPRVRETTTTTTTAGHVVPGG